jgi:endonuclease G, mitochondrial
MTKPPVFPTFPASRFLHHPDLRKEILAHLASNWPLERRAWRDIHDHFSALNIPSGFPATAVPPHPSLDLIAPASFQPESVDTPDLHLESIILPLARPVLLVQDNDFQNTPMTYWQQRLNPARTQIKQAILSVGRIELKNHDLYDWSGTAWLVRSNVAVTNAHVARIFASKRDGNWVFSTNSSGKVVGSRIDFREEYERPAEEELTVTRILYIEEGDGPDIALLQIQPDPSHSIPLALAPQVSGNTEVVTIGYPKYDSSIPDPDVLVSLFGGIYDVKRLSPGVVTEALPKLLKHDCSTLGGNSGSAVIDLASGQAVGLHFGGSYRISNLAVPAPAVSSLLAKLGL